MKGEVILSNKNRTLGFLYFEEFEGVKTDIDLKYMEDAIENLKDFRDKGLVPDRITLGISMEKVGLPGIAILFLDKKQKCGIAIAPMINEEESDK